MDRCRSCGCWDFYNECCTLPYYEKRYSCPVESEYPKNQKAFEEWAEEIKRRMEE